MSTRITRSWLVLSSFSVLACAPPQLVCPDGFALSAEGRCLANDAGTVAPIGDGSVSPDAGSDAGSDAAMAAADGGTPGIDAYVEGVDASSPPDAFVELPDAYVAPPDAYVAPDACAYGTWYVDADRDGFGSTTALSGCSQPAGTVSNATDCDDAAPTRHPGAPEICNGIDDDCDGVADVIPTWYLDADHDGHGTPLTHVQVCTMPPGYTTSSDDCDDSHATVYTGAPEICDGLRNDCTSTAPDAELLHTYYPDCDGDGFAALTATPMTTCQPVSAPSCGGRYVEVRPTDATNTDCEDWDPTRSPNTRWYADCDGDQYLTTGARSITSCDPPLVNACDSGTNAFMHGLWIDAPMPGADCWDFNAGVYPGETLYFTSAYSRGAGTSFDWDCDGSSTTRFPSADGCVRNIRTGACGPTTPTWLHAPPTCGISGQQFTCDSNCQPVYTNVVAACH